MPLISTTSAADEDIRRLFRENKNQIHGFSAKVTEHFKQKYTSEDVFNQIPVLGLSNPPDTFADGDLVVFHGMIQDTSLSSELYLAIGSNDEVGGWGLVARQDNDTQVQPDSLGECSVFWATSIPGLSPWTTKNCSEPKAETYSPLPSKYPIPGAPHIGVQLKVYDDALASPLRATDISIFIGILGADPLHSNEDSENPPNVPTLHVLTHNPLQSTVIPRSFPSKSSELSLVDTRQELIQWIATEGLDGDLIAAECILLGLIARVQSRTPPILPPSLTLSGFPPPSNLNETPSLHSVLQLIYPLINTIPVSLNVLNQTTFFPESKEEDLQSGWLQLPKGAIVLLNEGPVTEGILSSKGLSNVRTIQEAIASQILEYAFPFSGYRFETDLIFIVLTEGRKSTFFETNINVPLLKNSTSNALYKPSQQITSPSIEKLSLFRELIGSARIGNVIVENDTSMHIEQDFVMERSAGQFSADDLIQRLQFAKLVALSFQSSKVTINHYLHAKDLGSKIKIRQCAN